ncbi:MAG: ShlB/FhaC/HecB family hemolysin secretion/activation protein [Rhodocyclaceae bacterium]|nr:ShlB/FhaC/HecB family hemolysin secretion/activation protein [Rhodocyclaceae bacterium]
MSILNARPQSRVMRPPRRGASAWASHALWLALATSVPAYADLPQPAEPRFKVSGFEVEGDNPLSGDTVARLLAPYTGDAVGLTGLQEAANALEGALREAGYAFHRVTLPPQESSGVIKLRIVSFRLGKVGVTGNEHYASENVLASLPELQPDHTPNTRRLARDLALANDHPGKQLNLVMKESDQADRIDATVEVRDRPPLQVFASGANTGNLATGWWRTSVGAQYGNLFDRDHSLTLSYTTSPDHWSDVKQYGASYVIPLYGWGSSVTLLASRSNVNSGAIANLVDVTGRGKVFAAYYNQYLAPLGAYAHQVRVGLEDKLFETSISFSGTALPGSDVRSRPLSLRYEGKFEQVQSTAGFNLELAHNLSGGANNDQASYDAATGSRAGALQGWTAVRYGADYLAQFAGNWLASIRFRGQYASRPLIAGEQFGLGGASSVRGFEEREVSGDRGNSINLEASTPPLAENLRLAAFVDGGQIGIINPAPTQRGSLSIMSAGAGLRWRWREQFSLTLDAAHVLHAKDMPQTSGGDSKLHAALFYRF